MIEFRFDGKPQTKGRPRAGRNGGFYTPKATKLYEAEVARQYEEQGHPRLSGGISAEIFFTKGGFRMNLYERTAERAIPRSDLDNLAKAILDGLNGVAYADDSQIGHLLLADWT